MGSILNEFMNAVNESSVAPIPLISNTIDAVPISTRKLAEIDPMEISFDNEESLSVIGAAVKVADMESKLAGAVATVEDGGEQFLSFESADVKIPYYFKSYDELATTVLGNILQDGLKSINVSHFGKLLENTNPRGFTKAAFGKHEFYIKDSSDRMIYIFEFLVKAKEDLLSKRRFECDFVKEIELNHGIAYTLLLTPKELMDIHNSYPTYKISCVMSDDIKDLKLIIQV